MRKQSNLLEIRVGQTGAGFILGCGAGMECIYL